MTDPQQEMNILDLVQKLARARKDAEATRAMVDAARKRYEDEHSELIRVADEFASDATRLEQMVKALAVHHYKHDPSGNKHVAPGVDIIPSKEFDFEESTAIAWAVEQKHYGVLKLNTVEFKKICNSALAPTFVRVDDGWKARIARDLTTTLAEAFAKEEPHA